MFPSELGIDVIEMDRIYNKWRNISPVPRFDKLPVEASRVARPPASLDWRDVSHSGFIFIAGL